MKTLSNPIETHTSPPKLNYLEGWELQKKIEHERLKRLYRLKKINVMYERANHLQIMYSQTHQDVDFWRMSAICLRLLTWKLQCI